MLFYRLSNAGISPVRKRVLSRRLIALSIVGVLASFSISSHAQVAIDCEGTTPIYEIQGKGHISPFVGQSVETCGIVTAVGFNFYFLQDAFGDSDDETADGMFVFTTAEKPMMGDEIRISGEVSEFIAGGAATGNLSTTQMSFPEIIDSAPADKMPGPVVLGDGGRTPPAEIVISDDELPVNLQNADEDATNTYDPTEDAIDFYESIEGMLVTVNDAVAVSAIRQFGNFSAEVFTLADNGAAATPEDARTINGGIRLQPDPDNTGDQNPERIQIQFDGTVYQGENFPSIKVGDRLANVTGPVGYSFGNYEVYVIDEISPVQSSNMPEVVSGSAASMLSIASYNVLNLSAVNDDVDQLNKIADQIVNSLRSPDIIALQEIQDNNGDIANCDSDDPDPCSGVLDASESLQKLVDAIADSGGPAYASFNVDPLIETTDDNRDDPDSFGGVSLGNIRNAFVYNSERVDLIDFVGLTREELAARGVTESTAYDASRDPLQATFDFNGTEIIVLNNHFESRFGSTPIFGGPQPFVQAAEDAREAQSLAMHQLVNQYVSDNPMANVVVLGDLNTFEFTDDLADILSSAEETELLTRLTDKDTANEEYSFIFDGNSQALDHIFVTSSLADNATLDYVHVNVDFPRLAEDIVASDHEPVLALFSFSDEAVLGLLGEVYSSSALELFWNRIPEADEYQVVLLNEEISINGISYFVDNLIPSTTYEFTVRAVNDEGNVIAEEEIVLTTNGGVPQSPSTLLMDVSTAVYSSSAIELFWSADPVEFPNVLMFNVYRDGELVAETDGRSFFDEGLLAGTNYVYTIEYLINGVSAESVSVDVVTNGEPVALAPFNVTGLVYSSSALELFWTPTNTNASSYRIERDGNLLDTRDARSFFDTGLTAATSYDYMVSELDAGGSVIAISTISLTTR